MVEQYLKNFQRHLLVSASKRREIIEEINDHLSAYAYDQTGDQDPEAIKDLFGDPKLLAQSFNEAHIPLYKFVFNDWKLTVLILACMIGMRAVALQTGFILSATIPNSILRVELAGLVLHIGFAAAVIHACKPDRLFGLKKAFFFVCSVQLAVLILLIQQQFVNAGILLLQIIKGALYCYLITLGLPCIREWTRRKWLRLL